MIIEVARSPRMLGREFWHVQAALFILLGLFNLPLSAQSATTGAISGHILDAAGNPVQAAEIHLRTSNAHPLIVNWSSATGDLLLPALAPAEYAIDVIAPNGTSAHLESIRVELGVITKVRAALLPASTGIQVTVIADDDLDEQFATDTVLSTREILRLPTNGRGWQAFALLTAEANPSFSTASTGLLSFRGMATSQNASRIDGADDDQSFSGAPHGSGTDAGPETEDESESETQSHSGNSGHGYPSGSGSGRRPGAESTFAQEAVREFRVVGQNYSALYGHSAGGVITTVSRGGTDSVHGSVFYMLRESSWAATNPFSIATRYTSAGVSTNLVKPQDQRQQFGGSVGGPLARREHEHRLYYFYAVEIQRRSFPAISSPEDPSFYSLTDTQRALLENRGVGALQMDRALTYLDSLTGTVPRRADQTVNFFKIDSHMTPRSQISLQYNRSRFDSPAGLRSAPVVNRAVRSFGDQNINTDSLLGRWIYTRRSSYSNELRLQYHRDQHLEQAQAPLPQEPAIGPGGLAPEVAIGPQGLSFGTPSSIARGASPDEHRWQISDTAMLVYKQHLLQAGFDYSYVQDATDSIPNSAGSFHYDSGATNGNAGGLVDWITDYTFNVNTIPNGGCASIHAPIHEFCFRSFAQSFGRQSASFSTQEFAGFVQERWRASETLSLTAGLRYEYELLPIPQRPNVAVDSVFGTSGATSIFPEDRNNVGPRFAAAWQPFGARGGTVRAAYGLYFGRLPAATVRSALVDTATSGSATHVRILPTTVTACPQVANQGFGYPCTYSSDPPAGVSATTSITVFDRRFRIPMSQQASLSFERSFRRFATFSANYLTNINHQLPNSVDINIAPPTTSRVFQLQGGTRTVGVRDGDLFVIPIYTQRISSSFGPVTAITSNANGTYNAVVLEGRHRSRDGLEFRASWTWSKSIDFGQNGSSIPQTNGQFDPYDIRYDKGLSALNVPHKFVGSALWEPKFTTDRPLLKYIASGWLLAPVITESSGHPYSYNIFGGTRLVGGHESINGSGGELYLPTVGRDTLKLPDTFNINLRLAHQLHASETFRLQAQVEAFNLTNHVNYTSITQRAFLVGTALNGVTPLIYQDAATVAAEGLNSRPFGALTSASADSSRERQLQGGIRLEF